MDSVPYPSNDELRRMATTAATAQDPKRCLLDMLDDACKFSPPNWLVEEEFRTIWRALRAERRAGRMDPEDVDKSERKLRNEYRVIANRRVRLGLVIAEIGKRNRIDSPLRETAHERAAAYEDEVVDLIFGMAAVERT
jgi:FKBP-type peptidyl-prolyl cis-trans isomerase (trigger factor)